MLLILVATLHSCNQGPTLQTYYVDNELLPGFTSLDVPTSFLNIDEAGLTDEQKEAYNSIDKLNMLGFVIGEDNKAEYKVELAKIKTILKAPKYQELMRGGNATDGKFVIKFIGEEDSIDELILFGNAANRGFVIVRVLGDDMNVNKIMKLSSVLQNLDLDNSQLNQFTDFFK
ncbi:uncharacterized protein DUF4252 [Ichthyenterobacterium magnum]|uniref:Uncharacterized protein DUF4252 n=2 Tax=Ichthyenterobacterium magnum TaxID=1230530 RepID=A0A420DL80_9FLAO|nr:uncharacterized protein DUF4252 [Ichthyenterobacterium magnum]